VRGPRKTHLRSVIAFTALIISLAAMGAVAHAASPVYSFSIVPSSPQAGGHPDLFTDFRIGTNTNQPPVPCNCNYAKDIVIDTPPGLVGTPTALPQCTDVELATLKCPTDTQVGTLLVGTGIVEPLYNMVPRVGQLAVIATAFPQIFTVISSRTEGDYGLEFDTLGLPGIAEDEIRQFLWGVPADPIHNYLRFPDNAFKLAFCATDPTAEMLANEFPAAKCGGGYYDENIGENILIGVPSTPANSPAVPFTSAPTSCEGGLTATIETTAFDLERASGATAYPEVTGCDQLAFNSSLSAKPTTTEADAPSGLDVDLTVPQTLSATTPTPSAIKGVKVTLPPGFTINAGAADGKTACTDQEGQLDPPTREPAQCPEYSKIGTVDVTSSAFPAVLPGALYLGQPMPGSRYRVFLTADGFSLHVKLAGTATPDPQTGQLTLSFSNLPQFPFQEFNLHLFGAERGLLATPTQCGTYEVDSEFTPWAFPDIPKQSSTQFFTIDAGPGGSSCPPAPRPFSPRFQAGVVDNTAGAHSTFTLDLSRADGEQSLAGLSVATPPGFSATLKGVSYCPESAIDQLSDASYSGLAEQASPACPAVSQVGTATAGAGAGTHPLYAPGKVYLAGPYNGAPLSLVVVVPALSGPYDLGNVAVRVALSVDPVTAQVTADSDSLPQIIGGVPLRTRSILVNLDRADFALNPTNCEPFEVNAIATGDEGASAPLSRHFQVANCAVLPFHPNLRFRLTGSTKQAGNPALTAILTAKPGEANISRVEVTLPRTELVDNAHIKTICTRVRFAEGQNPGERCPSGSVLGFARAETPLLAKPLEGPIYLRSTGRAGLPDVVAALNGQIDIVLDGHVDSVHRRLRIKFRTVPDAPVTKAVFRFDGGHKGLIENSPGLCSANQHVKVQMVGQNGYRQDVQPRLGARCDKARHKRHRRHLRRARKAA
jgi:hypothetical protein